MNDVSKMRHLSAVASQITKSKLPRAIRVNNVAMWLQRKRVRQAIQDNMLTLGGGKA